MVVSHLLASVSSLGMCVLEIYVCFESESQRNRFQRKAKYQIFVKFSTWRFVGITFSGPQIRTTTKRDLPLEEQGGHTINLPNVKRHVRKDT